VTDPNVTAASPPPRGVGTLRVQMLRIMPVAGARAATVVLDREPVVIGRSGHVRSALALDDTEVSRHHAVVEPGGAGRWMVADQRSRNGTFVDGRRVDRAELHHGAVIRIGRTLIAYVEAELRGDERLAAPVETRLVGDSVPALRLHAEIGLVSAVALPVLVLGETGVGKELVAEEIHRRSGRTGAFVAINCAAIAPELAESELFGHVAGAFTGASRASEGLFVAADGGTLFLDEVGELPLDIQAKLLRALASGEVRAVGSSVARTVDARVVAATLRDLDTAVRQDRFRADLFNRIAGWRIEVPPLRDRRDDIAAIAGRLLLRHGALSLTADAAEALMLHDWSGNVRELERVIAAAAVRAEAARIDLDLLHLPGALAHRLGERAVGAASDPPRIPAAILPAVSGAAPNRDELCAVLEAMAGNVARVAEHYGKDRQQIYRWAKRYEIDLDAYRDPDPGA
jgi:transcriptional regulator with GAF, ATPase, and Fis domain